MYVHPPKKLAKALAKAAERGVKITIITNGYDKKASPVGHRIFGPRNRYEWRKIIANIPEEFRKNVTIHEYGIGKGTPRKTTYHKKVLVVDDTVFAGSSNIGYKSLVTLSDHELNFRAKSQNRSKRPRNEQSYGFSRNKRHPIDVSIGKKIEREKFILFGQSDASGIDCASRDVCLGDPDV